MRDIGKNRHFATLIVFYQILNIGNESNKGISTGERNIQNKS